MKIDEEYMCPDCGWDIRVPLVCPSDPITRCFYNCKVNHGRRLRDIKQKHDKKASKIGVQAFEMFLSKDE